jgi:hypothetical protein
MALLLRTVSKAKWVPPDWMDAGEVPADALSDLKVTDNAISVWQVEADRTNLEMIITALASSRERLDKIDYTLLDEAVLSEIRIESVNSEAVTPHVQANTAHRDLVRLTVKKVALLASEMMPLDRVRIPQKDVKRLLLEALRSGVIDRGRINSGLLGELEQKY